MDFVVDRLKWDRSTEDYNSNGELLTSEGNMCCLGFVCLQVGVSLEDLSSHCYPYEIFENKDDIYLKTLLPAINDFCEGDCFQFCNNDLSLEAASINDDRYSTDKNKEIELIALFKEYKHNISFIN